MQAGCRLSLTKRRFIGPTSMDAEVACIMANVAMCKRGSLAYDPFTGTASILVACAYFGATTLGGDMDIRVLRGDKRGWLMSKQFMPL